tara:strand:- start:7799 stop:8008 length:210 start_codon:yes stop_codon:yes gene_type:complete
MNKELEQYRREVIIHQEYNKEKFDIVIAHLEKINGRLSKVEKDITTHKSVGITLTTLIGFVLTYLGIKE